MDLIREYIESKNNVPGLVIAPVAAGKALLIAETAKIFGNKVLVLQPSKELLLQNISKLQALGGEATIFSASCNMKELSGMTYATLGSVKKVVNELKEIGISYVIIDEVHCGYSPEPGSEFMRFITKLNPKKVIGFTATPCRLFTFHLDYYEHFSMLKFLTRMKPCYFKTVIHVVQVEEMLREGFWSDLKIESWRFDGSKLILNSNGSEYTEESMREAVEANGINNLILRRLSSLNGRKSILIFMDSVENCQIAADWVNKKGVYGEAASIHGGLGKKERDRIVDGFKNGDIRIVFNHSVLLAGFDHPGLDTVIFGRPTFSFPTYYQSIGRGLRIKEGKRNCLFIDCCDNGSRFGDIRQMGVEDLPGFGWAITVGNRIITNVPMEETLTKEDVFALREASKFPLNERLRPGRPDVPEGDARITFGMYQGWKFKAIPTDYLKFLKDNISLSRKRGVMEYIKAIGL